LVLFEGFFECVAGLHLVNHPIQVGVVERGAPLLDFLPEALGVFISNEHQTYSTVQRPQIVAAITSLIIKLRYLLATTSLFL